MPPYSAHQQQQQTQDTDNSKEQQQRRTPHRQRQVTMHPPLPPPPPSTSALPPPSPPAMMMKMNPGVPFDPSQLYCGAVTSPDDTTTQPRQEAADSSSSAAADASSPEERWQTVSQRSLFVMQHEWKAPHHAKVLQSLLIAQVPGVQGACLEQHRGGDRGGNTNASTGSSNSILVVQHVVTCAVQDIAQRLATAGYPATFQATQETTDLDELVTSSRNSSQHDAAGNPVDDDVLVETVRTTLYVQGLCCATEVPSVRKVLKRLPGIAKIALQPTVGRVTVHHAPNLTGAARAAEALTHAGFPTTVLSTESSASSDNDNNNNHAPSTTTNATSTTIGRSTLHATATLHAGDVVPIQHAAASVPGVLRIGIKVVESAIYVEHDWSTCEVTAVQEKLTLRGYPTTVVQDAHVVALQQQSQALVAQPRSKYVESTLYVSNLTAAHTSLLAKAVRQQFIRAQVRALHPHVSSKTVKVEHNPDLLDIETLAAGLRPYGLDVSVVTDGQAEQFILPLLEDEQEQAAAAKAAAAYEMSGQLSLNVIFAGMFWILSMLSLVGEDEGADSSNPFWWFQYFALLAVALGLPPVAVKAVRTLLRKEFDSNCMMVTAAVGALLLGEWDEAASVAFLFSLSEYLERRATERARRALTQISNLRPEYCHWIHPETNQIWVVPSADVPVGSLISVRTGDKIAADGIVVRGTSQVDESSLTGESVPIRKAPDNVVQGGSINVGSTPLVIQTTSSVADSTVSRLIRLVEDAQTNTSETEKLIDSFARAYTPAVVAIAAAMCTLPWIWGIETGQTWTLRGLILIVVACPCALTISTPVTYAAGLAATAQRGIVIKGGAYLEALGHVKTVLLDKTGTITEGKFQIKELAEIGELHTRKEMLALLAVMEAPSSHPLSATLVKAAAKEGVQVPTEWEVKDHTILKGEGVTALVEGKQIYVGNQRLFDRLGIYLDLPVAYKASAQEWQSKGASVGFVGVERVGIVGMYAVTDAVRPEAPDVVATLQVNDIRVEMLTGDGDGAARSVAQQVGLPSSAVHAKLLPEDKLHLVGRMSSPQSRRFLDRRSKVLFCGDGVNDGPALAVADVGVAMGEGASSLATEVSDVSLMDANLNKLVDAIFMGQRVVTTITQNIGLSLFCKFAVVGLTMAGHMSLFGAIASDVGVMLIVTLNGMRLLPSYRDLSKQERQYAERKYDQLPLAGRPQPLDIEEMGSYHDDDDDGIM